LENCRMAIGGRERTSKKKKKKAWLLPTKLTKPVGGLEGLSARGPYLSRKERMQIREVLGGIG